ncbi:alpha/beta fold hydrolase [Leucobacter sp. CSA2]|uniref:Alpha/beta fold hydrolase n=2 Tax=Leucobacter edaphi TaxID=2796472 RepID=A0A934UXT7_9MICO|nr:alpha/beta fold hydrolase [Leucobacter edaphi]
MKKLGRILGIGAGLGAGVFAIGAGAAALGGLALARRSVTPEDEAEELVSLVSLERDESGLIARFRGPSADVPGRTSFLFDRGRGNVQLSEAILPDDGPGVARRIVAAAGTELHPGRTGRLTGWWYLAPEDLGFRTERIEYETELGPATAWIVHPKRAKRGRWAVHVHGRGAEPAEVLRGVRPAVNAGITSLVISYRNDRGAPRGVEGRYGMGLSESRDVDAAIAEALRRGADRVTLFGWSMGGTASLLAATIGEHRDRIDGVILDSPGVDWESLLRHHAGVARAPKVLTDIGIGLLERGLVRGGEPGGIKFERLTPEAFAENLRVPVLLHASRGDTYVPSTGAERLAALAPDRVQLNLVDEGEHVRIWNMDPEAWESRTELFARSLPKVGWRG